MKTEILECAGPTDPLDARLEHAAKLMHWICPGPGGHAVTITHCRRAGGQMVAVNPWSDAAERISNMRRIRKARRTQEQAEGMLEVSRFLAAL